MSSDPLNTALLDLLHAVQGSGFPLILGGGYGLYLKQLYLQRIAPQTLIDPALWPSPRSTEDLDIFLQTEVVCSSDQMLIIRSALDKLNFKPVENAKYLHFEKILIPAGLIKIDFLTGPLPQDTETKEKIRFTRPRAGPRKKVQLHAYVTDEALLVEDDLTEIPISGFRSGGETYASAVYIPQPFTFLLMKLHAFHDRMSDPDKELGRYHALDVYRIITMMTENEYKSVLHLIDLHRASEPLVKANKIVSSDFSDKNAIGCLRLREHPLFSPRMDVDKLLSILHEFFG